MPVPAADAGMREAVDSSPVEADAMVEPCTNPDDCPDDFVYPEETQAEGGTILRLAVTDEHDHPLEQYEVHHPIRIKFTIKATAADHHDQIVVGLVEKHEAGSDHMDVSTCRLGEFHIDFYAHDVDGEAGADNFVIEKDFIVPDDCLPDGAGEKVFNLWVSENPAKDDHPSAVARGGVALGDYNIQFFNAEQIDTDGLD
jgi:hypothetical protein